MIDVFRFKIAIQTMKDFWKITIIVSLLFMVMAAMYAGMFPQFEESLLEMMESGFADSFNYFPHADQMATYIGFLTIELYAIFWLLILAIILGFISAASITKEIEGKTIDLLMSNPISRKQIVFEKFIGLIPMVLIVNFATMIAVIGITAALNESLNLGYLLLVHLVSIPYFLAVISIGILISTFLDEKMKASITMIAILVGMYTLYSMSLMSSGNEFLGYISINKYFDPFDVLKYGEVDIGGVFVYIIIITVCLILSMIYFEHRDIEVT
jgi:ABC-2 type transport system permease protein